MSNVNIEFPNYSKVRTVADTKVQLMAGFAPNVGSYANHMRSLVEGHIDKDFENAGLRNDLSTTWSSFFKGSLRTARLWLTAHSDAPMASYFVAQSAPNEDVPLRIVGVSNVARHSGSVRPTTKQERMQVLIGNHYRDTGERLYTGVLNDDLVTASPRLTAEVVLDETIRAASDAGVKELYVSRMELPKVAGLTVIEQEADLGAAGFVRTGEPTPVVVNNQSYAGENWVMNLQS